MKLGIPQLIILAIYMLDLGISLAKHGEPKKGKYSFWTTLIGSLIGLYILNCGGFFS